MRSQTARVPSSPVRSARIIAAIAFAGLLSASCNGSEPAGPGTIVNIVVTPDVTMPTNGVQQFVAEAKDASGVVIEFSPTWSVVAGGGTISTEGLFTAGTTPGVFVTTVQAASGGITGHATVTVTADPLADLGYTVSPGINGIVALP